MSTANRWEIGVMYYQGAMNGTPNFYTQPDGPGTQVFPTQKNNQPWPEWPAAGGMIINETTPWWSPPCGHSLRFWQVIREYDYDNDVSCALVTCSYCSFVVNVIRPFEEWLNPQQFAIIVG